MHNQSIVLRLGCREKIIQIYLDFTLFGIVITLPRPAALPSIFSVFSLPQSAA